MTTYDSFLSPLGRNLHESVLRKMGQVIASRDGRSDFVCGRLSRSGRLSRGMSFATIAAELLSGKDGSVLQYGPTRGYRPLLESILGVLDGARHHSRTSSEVMTTSGSQQGLDLIARVLIAPGDVVLVEVPTYTGAIAAFRNAQCRLVGVEQDADGINLDDLDARVSARARRRRAGQPAVPRAELSEPDRAFSSASTKRARLLAWAERRDILIIEDDPYGELYFEDVATRGGDASVEGGRHRTGA